MAIEQVEPARCMLWQFHERLGEELNGESCKELIVSIQRHGQRQPVLGRKLSRADGAGIELIYGARRLFAATQLGVKLTVDVRELDDRAAIFEMEIENRLRTDISPYERGLSYRRWLSARLFTCQSDLAKSLDVSEAQVSRLLRYADLPAAVVSAFGTVQSIREEWAVSLAKLCQDSGCRPNVLRRARELSQGEPRYSPQVIFRRLVSATQLTFRDGGQARDEIVRSPAGRPIYRIALRAKTVHFIVPRDSLSEQLLHELKHQLACTLQPATDGKETGRRSHLSRTNHAGIRAQHL